MRLTQSPRSTSAVSAGLEQCECAALSAMHGIAFRHWRRAVRQDWQRLFVALTSTRRKKQHADLQANLERDAERLRETGSLPAADKYMPLIYPADGDRVRLSARKMRIVIIEDTPRLRDAVARFPRACSR